MTAISMPCMACALMTALALPTAWAQSLSPSIPQTVPVAQAAPHQVLHLSTSAQTEVTQDWLVMTMSVQREGLQAPAVQKQLNGVLSSALAVATPLAKPGALDVSTGEMNVSPRYGRDGKMNGWVGSAQLILQGRDAVQIATLAARLQDFTVAHMDWRLSPEQKTAAEARIQAEAVSRFQNKAQSLTQQLVLRPTRSGKCGSTPRRPGRAVSCRAWPQPPWTRQRCPCLRRLASHAWW